MSVAPRVEPRSSIVVAARLRSRAWPIAVSVGLTIWALVTFTVVRDAYLEFRLGRYDLGNMVQAVWSTVEGRPLEWTEGSTGEQVSRLASHVDPILALLAPLWALAPSPLTLAAVQVVAVALGALPVFWLARLHTGSERAAGILAFAYLAYPWTAWTAVDAVHPVTLAIPLLLFCVWFLERDLLVPFAVAAALVVATGELMGVIIAGLGVWYALARGRRLAGLVIAVAGVGATLVSVYLVLPAFAGGSSPYYALFADVGGSPTGVVGTALTDPLAVLAEASRPNDLLYLFLLAAPVGGLFLLAPFVAALALPQLAFNLLAGVGATTHAEDHYIAGIVPFVFAAIAIGLGRLSSVGRMRAAAVVLTLSLASSLALGPWPGAILDPASWHRAGSTPERTRALRDAVALVPSDAPVSATNFAGSHLADRRYLFAVPMVDRASWIVLELADTWVPQRAGGFEDPAAIQDLRNRVEGGTEWEKVYDRAGVLVYRKVEE